MYHVESVFLILFFKLRKQSLCSLLVCNSLKKTHFSIKPKLTLKIGMWFGQKYTKVVTTLTGTTLNPNHWEKLMLCLVYL